VSEGVLTACMRTLRQALGEDAQQPRYIVTVHRLGYRFVAPVTAGAPVTPPGTPPSPPASPPLVVGRAAELAQLHTWFAQARQGGRQMVFVTGEAGMGKTTLVDAFLADVAAAQTAWIGRGQCIEHFGAGEAYLPLLEVLGRLGRGPDGERLVACLRQYAPTWLVQLPALVGEAERAALRQQGQGVTPQRMLRELAEALEALTAEQPLIVVLEDVPWSDASTVEALALLARRRDAARLMVIGTYRPVELIVRAHPLKALKQELALHRHCAEVPLGYLNRAAVQAYLAQRGPPEVEAAELAAWVQRRTEGHPLFMVHVVEELAHRGWLTAEAATEAAGQQAYARAWALSQQLGDPSQLGVVLVGLWRVALMRGELQRTHELGEDLLRLGQRAADPAVLLDAHYALGVTDFWRSEVVQARAHLEQSLTLGTAQHTGFQSFAGGTVPWMVSLLGYTAWSLWVLGYPAQGLKQSREAVILAQELVEAVIALSGEQGFPFWLAMGPFLRGWVLVAQGQREEGIAQLHRGLTAYRATGAKLGQLYDMILPYWPKHMRMRGRSKNSAFWPRDLLKWRKLGSAGGRPSYIGPKGNSS
jgi:AAA ATPase domain